MIPFERVHRAYSAVYHGKVKGIDPSLVMALVGAAYQTEFLSDEAVELLETIEALEQKSERSRDHRGTIQ